MLIRRVVTFTAHLYCRIRDDEVPALGAQLTYYLILAFFPFLLVLISLLAFTPLTEERVIADISSIMPHTAGKIVRGILTEAQTTNRTVISLGTIATLWASSNGMMAMVRALNKAYDEDEKRPYWKVRALAVVYTIALSLAIITSFTLFIFGEWVGAQLFVQLGLTQGGAAVILWNTLRYGMTLLLLWIVFTLLYRTAPSRPMRWRETLPGAAVTAISWLLVSSIFSYYVNHFPSYSRLYGSIGGIIVLLLWLYIGSVLIIVGGEVNAVFAFDREGRRKPACKIFGVRLPFWDKA